MQPTAVAICGRPNVGKSTLFNILVKDAKALVHNEPGVTRDWVSGHLADSNQPIKIVDTAGLEGKKSKQISNAAWQRSIKQLELAQVVLFVVDARSGLLPDDQYLASILRKQLKKSNVILVANKAENLNPNQALAEFHKLGFSKQVVTSAAHSFGIDYLIEEIQKYANPDNLEIEEQSQENENIIRFALLGRPNVGKSTLANQILSSDRMLVADAPGTTVDSIEELFVHKNRTLAIVDSAGIRRKARITEDLEKTMTLRARKSITSADVILLIS